MQRSSSPEGGKRLAASRRHSVPLPALALLLLGSCGFGTAAAVGASGGGGGSDVPPALTDLVVRDPGTLGEPKISPAEIHFVLKDVEGEAATVEFVYEAPGRAPEAMAQLTTLPSNPVQLPASAQGIAYSLPWDFAMETELPDDASYREGVLVSVRVNGETTELAVGLGNDPPEIAADPVPAEVDGVVPVRLHMRDSSSDAIRIQVHYDVQDDVPDAGWLLARPAGLAPGEPTPDHAFEGIVAEADGSDVVFFWDSDFRDDLRDLERDVQLRFTPSDPVIDGEQALTNVFRVDNNEEPVLQLHADALLANPDSARGIPVPLTVIDEESDEVTVVFQWRREGEAFPQLPGTPAEIEALLADPDERREHHVCDPYLLVLEGRTRQIDATHVRLPELGAQFSHIAPRELAGRELEFPRPANRLEIANARWASNPLVGPAAALPSRGGTHVLVLDAAAGGWRLVELDLEDGSIARLIATGGGLPTASCFQRGEEGVLVAHRTGAAWGVDLVDLATGLATHAVDAADGPVEQGAIRGIASLGANAALVTVGSSLVRVDWTAASAPRAVTVRAGLATPWGIAVDPLEERLAYVAENTAPGGGGEPGRVVAVDLDTWAVRPVVADPNAADGFVLPRPRGLALLRGGSRLLAVCEPTPGLGTVEVRGLELGVAARTSVYVYGLPLDAGVAGIASAGREDLLAAASSVSRDVVIAGGVRARATIHAVDRDVVTLARALESPVPLDAPWRTAVGGDVAFRATSSPEGVSQAFTWDSETVIAGGAVFLRATPFDAEVGTITSMTGAKRLWASFHDAGQPLPAPGAASVATADLDVDGDLDVAVANSSENNLMVFWQTGHGVFDPTPTVLGGFSVTRYPNSIQAADVDGNGYLDLLSANSESQTMTVFLQTAPGIFDPDPIVVGGVRETPYVLTARAADLDGDGDLDLVSGNSDDWRLSIFRQTAPLVFDSVPEVLGIGLTFGFIGGLEVADVDGDGNPDLVTSDPGTRTQSVYWQTAPDTFEHVPTTLGAGYDLAPSNSVEVVDLDTDGDLDLLASDMGAGVTASVFWQSSPGVFAPQPSMVSGGYTLRARAGDMDGDGDLDLVCANDSDTSIVWQTAPGQFERTRTNVGGPFGLRSYDAVPADLDGDGDLDVVSANPFSGTVEVAWQTGFGRVESTPTVLGPFAQPVVLQAVDLDADADLDLISSVIQEGRLVIHWQLVPGTFDPNPTSLGDRSTTSGPVDLIVLDIDRDGDLDLASVNVGVHTISIYWQTARGVFDPDPTTLGGPDVTMYPYGLQAKDIDGDGRVDLALANSTADSILVFWQNAAGAFDPVPTPVGPSLLNPSGLTLEDLDGDGDEDFAFVFGDHFENSTAVGVLWQLGPRVFSETPVQLGGSGTTQGARMLVADVDGDGRLDLVAANYYSNTFTVFWQTAQAEYDPTPTTVQNVLGIPYSLVPSDVDRDGDLDLLSVGDAAYNVSVYWQTGPRVFDAAPVILPQPMSLSAPRHVEAIDVDQDGDIDLLSRNVSSSSVFWQTTPGSFDPVPTVLADYNALGPVNTGSTLDIDRDGERDLLFAAQSSLRLFWAWRGDP